MKKTFILILATFMLICMQTGCEKDSTDTQPPTQPQASVGDILDAPEVRFDTSVEDLYIYFTYPGESESEVLSMEIAIDQLTDDSYVVYVTDGLLKINEVVYEVTNNSITKYHRGVFTSDFERDTILTQTELKQEEARIMNLLRMFMVAHPDWQDMQYRKTDENAFAITGEVYTYDLIKSSEVWGKICIDKATGLLVSLRDTNGASLYTVQSISLSNLEIPEYK